MRDGKMDQIFYDAVGSNPIIAAVKSMEDIEKCCAIEEIQVIFILFGDVCSIREIVQQIKDSGKVAMVHIDLISGLSSKEIVVDFIRKNTEADGIISTKAALIKRGKELKMFTVLRYFLLDSMAYENIRQQQHAVKPDYIEVLPGVMPKVIGKVCKMSKTPIIAGGLISDKESVMAALSAGAIAVSSTNHEVWKM
jgi:glycerol uptake operon antiterminator